MLSHQVNRPMSLGCRIKTMIRSKRTPSQLATVSCVLLAALIVSIALAYGSIYFFHLRVIAKFEKTVEENPYVEIVQHTVPKIQDWYASYVDTTAVGVIPAGRRTFRPPTTETQQCLIDWFTLLSNTINPLTSIEQVDAILTQMGIIHLPMVRYYFQDYLSGPMAWEAVAAASQTCLLKSSTVTELACTLYSVYQDWSTTTISESVQADLEYTLHIALVLERLTTELQNDFATLHQIANIMADKPLVHENSTQFFQDKRGGIVRSLKLYATAAAEGSSLQTNRTMALRVNILEAVLVDIENGRTKNALLGLDLASAVSFEPEVQSVNWHLGRAWVDAYIGWNLRFVASSLSLSHLGKLLIPSVSCTLEDPSGESFIFARVISLALSI